MVILQIGTFRLQTYRPGRPLLTNQKHQMYILLVVFIFLSQALSYLLGLSLISMQSCSEVSVCGRKCLFNKMLSNDLTYIFIQINVPYFF